MNITYNGKPYRDTKGRFSSIWKSIKWFSTRVFIGVGVSFLLLGVYVAGGYGNPVVKAELIKEGLPPILIKIANAESLNSHFCTEKLVKANLCKRGALGTVLVNTTLDVGKYQINLPANGAWCLEKGFDVFNEKQNEECAKALFYSRGSEPWSSSKSKWNK